MYWKKPHINKVYEAITSIADKRIIQDDTNPYKAKCYSSSGNKYYEVELATDRLAMMSNDNSAYYTDTLSYPMIALLMLNKRVEYPNYLNEVLSGIFWKDINQKYNNDYDKSIDHVLNELVNKGVNIEEVKSEIRKVYEEVLKMDVEMLGEKIVPPRAY